MTQTEITEVKTQSPYVEITYTLPNSTLQELDLEVQRCMQLGQVISGRFKNYLDSELRYHNGQIGISFKEKTPGSKLEQAIQEYIPRLNVPLYDFLGRSSLNIAVIFDDYPNHNSDSDLESLRQRVEHVLGDLELKLSDPTWSGKINNYKIVKAK
jgi:hypothetical protein